MVVPFSGSSLISESNKWPFVSALLWALWIVKRSSTVCLPHSHRAIVNDRCCKIEATAWVAERERERILFRILRLEKFDFTVTSHLVSGPKKLNWDTQGGERLDSSLQNGAISSGILWCACQACLCFIRIAAEGFLRTYWREMSEMHCKKNLRDEDRKCL